MTTQTKIFRNTTKVAINVPGLGEIPAGEQVSITGVYLTPVVVENHPGLVEITHEDYVEPETKKKKEK